jgi:uncharacterized protein YjbI with pentapeptide repeats
MGNSNVSNPQNIKGLLVQTIFSGAIFRKASFVGVVFENCDFQKVIFLESDLSTAKIIGCDFRGAVLLKCNLDDTDLSDSDFRSSIVVGTTFNNAILDRANFSDSRMNEEQFLQAKSSQDIILREPGEDKIKEDWGERLAVQLFLEEDLLSKLENEAKSLSISLNDLAVFALMKYLADQRHGS